MQNSPENVKYMFQIMWKMEQFSVGCGCSSSMQKTVILLSLNCIDFIF